MKRKLVVGNWKMNGDRARNRVLLDQILGGMPSGVDCAVCVPFPYLAQVNEILEGSGIALGAQDVSEFSDGAYTGDVSVAMLADWGVRFVVVGHSERRTLHHESDEVVARKTVAVLDGELTPIVCVGETLAERESGVTEQVLMRQLDALAAVLPSAVLQRVVIAYEPVWAIGTGRAATAEQVQAVLSFVRGWLARHVEAANEVRVLYGGSVKPETAEALFGLPDADGGLIGGASLDAPSFLEICRAAANTVRGA
ncbi:triose-phosphate isomerase [Aromatoleum toluvorans]|uniref:Triosephosphate isomerase n=1 Tax=Aromatoleum toluvorans TaxID=92002 RepID=A0ABX1PXQ5_9RHOO|nr:triose-phosphate isomerase [Aromatoleum toluvorans]NMG43462.1 triose-phosphate isomerase [Aromatoleum toluvorans]